MPLHLASCEGSESKPIKAYSAVASTFMIHPVDFCATKEPGMARMLSQVVLMFTHSG